MRSTKETRVTVRLNLDGGDVAINTGVGFFDHMLEGFARHGLFDLSLFVEGDLQVDTHHTIEDTGIVLGKAIKEAVGDKKGMVRYGSMILPMDEALILCALDLCGRPYLVYDLKLDREGRRVFIGEKEINLTAKEFDLLELLVCNPNKVYSRESLLSFVWGNKASESGDVRTVDVHVRRLREKIEPSPSDPKYVHTKWGVGYYFRA